MKPHRLAPLLVLVTVVYFVQGIIEPTACLPAQPLQTQLREWQLSTGQIGHFFGVIGLGWSLKPLLGLISDFVPILGYRRRPYLIASTALASAGYLAAARIWPGLTSGVPGQLTWLLVAVNIGIAMTDVVTDGLAVETAQPLNATGQIQAAQWMALSVAGLIVGSLGGFIVQHHLQRSMLLGCGVL